MPVPIRRFYGKKLIEAKEQERKSYEDAKDKRLKQTKKS